MGRFHVGPSEASMDLRAEYARNPDKFVAPEVIPASSIAIPAVEIKTEIIEKIVEVVREVKVPEYITVIKEVKVEVPVMMEVEKIVEKIVEIPKIQIVEKPMPVIREIIDVNAVLLEKKAHGRTKNKLKIAYIVIAFLGVLTMLTVVK